MKKSYKILLLVIFAVLITSGLDGFSIYAQDVVTASGSSEVSAKPNKATKDFDPFVEDGSLGHFTWGVELSSGVDMTTRDMTNFAIGAEFGYKNTIFRMLGVGATIISMMNNASRCYPIYAMVRTSFSRHHQLCFLEARGGISINNILDSRQSTGGYGSLGVGVTLAHRRSFSSHIVLRGEVIPVKGRYEDPSLDFSYVLGFACIGIGVAF